MAAKKKKQDVSVIIITVVAAVLAIAAVIFLIWTFSGANSGGEGDVTTTEEKFAPTQELIDETEKEAYRLVQDNYKIYCLLTMGMNVEEEPYGNKPEDGFYTCISDEFKTFADWSELVRNTYTEAAAVKVLSDPFGKGVVYGDDNGVLGLSEDFVPSDPDPLWEGQLQYVCTPLSESECKLELTLTDKTTNEKVNKEMTMERENGVWKLTELVY